MLTKVIRAEHRILGRKLATKIGNSCVDLFEPVQFLCNVCRPSALNVLNKM